MILPCRDAADDMHGLFRSDGSGYAPVWGDGQPGRPASHHITTVQINSSSADIGGYTHSAAREGSGEV